MSARALLQRFDIVADHTSNIPALRRLVVDLAVRGKLLPVESFDMSAQEMLERISAKADELVAAGVIKKSKPASNIDDEEVPAAYLAHCTFARLGSVANLQKGLTGIQSSLPGQFPLVVTAAERSTCEHFDFDGAAAIIPLVSSTGHGNASINRLHFQEGKFALGTILCAVFPFDEQLVSARFLYEYLTAFKEELLVSKMIGTANVTLTLGKISDVPVPIVAPAVQKRVDELMVLCDQLEAAQQERERRRDRLAAASLRRLNQPAADTTPEAQREHARFHLHHLPRLANRPEHIKAMRQTILNLAVRGKLVEQDAEDESAAELLQRIRLSTTQPVTSGKPKKVKPLSLIAIQEEPYPAPMGWSWVRMGLIGETNIGLTYSPANLANAGTPVLRSSNIQNGTLDLCDLVRVNVEVKESVLVQEGDLLICARNGSKALVGKTALISGLTEKMAFGAFMAIFRSPYNAYLLRFINSQLFRAMISDVNTTTINQITQENLKSALLPLPPLNEQHRIVAKVDELMALCDQLEAQLTTTQTDSRRLLEAVLEAALAPD